MHALFAQPCLNVCKTSLLLLKVKGSIDNSPISAVVHDLSKVLGTFYRKQGFLVVLIFSFIYPLQVHPIFVLSIADLMLAFLWVIGGVLWLTSVSNHLVWCFMATLMTVVSVWGRCGSIVRGWMCVGAVCI